MAPTLISNMLNTFLCFSLLFTSFTLAAPVAEKRGLTWRFPYGSQKVRGVNLGGWLVLEPWITPSLFENTNDTRIIDEWTFGQYVKATTAKSTLKTHWDTWITESDFAAIAAAGLNHVRLPIGYWAFDVQSGEPYITGQLPYLYKAVDWAKKYNIKVWIDLHGAPGSQNGFDNSGHKTDPKWQTSKTYIARTSAIIKTLAKEFSQSKYSSVVTAIAPLNEPAGFKGNDIIAAARQYWLDSYGNIRYPYGTSQQGNLIEVIHDTFQPLSYWNGFANYPKFDGVMMDTHSYQVFSSPELERTYDQHVQAACARGKDMATFAKSNIWTVAGEWTTAPTDCAKYLNGRGVGARYDGTFPGSYKIGSCSTVTGSSKNFSDDYKKFMRKYWEAQTAGFEKANGWIYWAWKNENADDWSYQKGLSGGWIPKNPNDRMYPGICG